MTQSHDTFRTSPLSVSLRKVRQKATRPLRVNLPSAVSAYPIPRAIAATPTNVSPFGFA